MKRIGAAGLALCLAVLQVGLVAEAAGQGGQEPVGKAPSAPGLALPLARPWIALQGELLEVRSVPPAPSAPPPSALLAPDNSNATPPATITVENVPSRLSGTRVLPAYSIVVFRLEAADGDSIIFQADAPQGGAQVFDSYLFNAQNYSTYSTLREGGDANANVTFFIDYSRAKTEHTAFTTEPLPAGTYFVVLDNDERLGSGADPNGTVSVTFAVALVNNSLPPAALWVILVGAAAAIYATIRWRPVFDARSPLLGIEGDAESDEEGAEDDAHPDMDEGEGPPPHPL
jgi:hypothetical protein